ncbi:type I-E CRISPR-associated protein Cas6/Cse3/CasE [Candidatus Nitrotoga fabula]|uniref:CRISPR system Cascade subunit CasE n=1 Tax=Candidatus Nitrotoga fabula TaxID=2182327 RepID=A0A916FAV8_9PROT|nr:type I-E CRISPR-associated protein Cas6/Cse3/CasE [Candidatus Nitrotoga fabula]CAE6710892.1 CRISPR system Cascade subunit CasE [Candidatus Nitrotoga fabula]
MSENALAYASVLRLNRTDMKILNIKDAYSLHKIVYGLFDDARSDIEKHTSISSGIVYTDKGGDFNSRQILMLSNRKPHQTPQFGEVITKPIHLDFLAHQRYTFEVTLNPSKRDNQTGKIVPIRGRKDIEQWFKERATKSWGFSINPENLQTEKVSVQVFEKMGKIITHGSATLKGELKVINQDRFIISFIRGIGRGRAFGFGLLQIVPLVGI